METQLDPEVGCLTERTQGVSGCGTKRAAQWGRQGDLVASANDSQSCQHFKLIYWQGQVSDSTHHLLPVGIGELTVFSSICYTESKYYLL